MIENNQQTMIDKSEIASSLAKHFGEMSSTAKYPQKFTAIKNISEQTPIQLCSDNTEIYNSPLTHNELKSAL